MLWSLTLPPRCLVDVEWASTKGRLFSLFLPPGTSTFTLGEDKMHSIDSIKEGSCDLGPGRGGNK